MNEITRRLYEAAEKFGVSGQSNVARLLGESPQTVKNWEARGVSKTGMIKAQDIFGCDANWLATGKGSRELSNTSSAPPLSTVPLISWVAAGFWADVIDNNPAGQGDAISTSYQARRHTFALRVQGDSMEPRFPEGCLIIVEPDEQAAPGKFVVVRQNGDSEATFKQLIQDGGTLYLKPLNARYPIMPMRSDAVIAGVVKRMEMDI